MKPPVLTIWSVGLLFGFGGIVRAPDDVAAVAVRAHKLCAISMPTQGFQFLQNNETTGESLSLRNSSGRSSFVKWREFRSCNKLYVCTCPLLVGNTTVDSAYRGHCLPWTTLNRRQSAMHPAFWGKNSAYCGQLSQLWTVDTISWHQGALSLLTMDSRQSTIFFFKFLIFILYFLLFLQLLRLF